MRFGLVGSRRKAGKNSLWTLMSFPRTRLHSQTPAGRESIQVFHSSEEGKAGYSRGIATTPVFCGALEVMVGAVTDRDIFVR